MSLLSQGDYWSNHAYQFDAIYSHKKKKVSVLLDKVFRKAMFDRFKYTIAQSEPISAKSFLDAGCGTGLFSLELARREALKVLGIDVAEKMLEICKTRARKEALESNTDFRFGDISNFESREKYDITIGMGLLDYISDPGKSLSNMRRLTREKVLLSFPVRWNWRTIPRWIRLRLKRCPVYFYTRRQIVKLMTDAGFTKVVFRKMGPMFFVTGY